MSDLSFDPDSAGDSSCSGDEGCHFSDEDEYDDDGSYPSDDEEESMPDIVVREMERREKSSEEGGGAGADELGPPSEEVVEALREHFLSGRSDFFYGGFVECMERVGGKVSARDALVYLPEYNVSYIVPAEEDEDPNFEEEMSKRHDARVRLLRYQELIDAQAKDGICIGDDWVMSAENGLCYKGPDKLFDYEGSMSREALFACLMNFSQEYFLYANHDNLLAGIGSGVKTGSRCTVRYPHPVPRHDFTTVQMDVDEGVLHDQCDELYTRYEELRCPLGPWMNLRTDENSTTPPAPQSTRKKVNKGKRGKKGKKNRGGNRGGNDRNSSSDAGGTASANRWKPHAEEIRTRLAKLLGTMKDHLLSSDAGVAFAVSIAKMLTKAATYDSGVAKAFVNEGGSNCGSLVIDIHARILATAKESGKKHCWILHAMLLDVLGASIQTMLKQDGARTVNDLDYELDNPATSFFIDTMAPLLLPSVKSEIAEERGPALSFFESVVLHVPHSPMLRLMSKKKVWGCFEAACRLGLMECDQKTDDAVSSSWHNYMKLVALGTLASVLSHICTGALALEEDTDAVTPTALAVKMVKRGVVPLLMEISKADLGYPSTKAMVGLAAISRVKDCRTIIYQDPSGLELLKSSLSSPDGSMVSPTLLLVLHLNWDEEWTQPLSSIRPELPLTCVRWALFAMQRIIKRANDAKKESDETKHKFMRLTMDALLTNDDEEKKRLEQLANDEKQKLALNEWWNLESEEHRSAIDSFLCRCLLLLSALVRLENGSQKILQAGGLSLFSTCLDVPIHDTKKGCVFGLNNQLVAGNAAPSMFYDPDHYVRAIMILLHESIEAGVSPMEQLLRSLMMLANSLRRQAEWRPHFEELPPMYQQIADILLDRCSMAPPTARACPRPQRAISPGRQIHEKNAKHTGKLRSCDSCGKLETKKGEMLACSKCHKVTYCSKECQIAHWKAHKSDCKKWRKG